MALILNSALHVEYSRSKWLKEEFDSPWDVLDELMSIRVHEYKGKTPKVSEFFGSALDIFDELGFEVPKGCRPKSRMKPRKPLTKVQKMAKKARKDLRLSSGVKDSGCSGRRAARRMVWSATAISCSAGRVPTNASESRRRRSGKRSTSEQERGPARRKMMPSR